MPKTDEMERRRGVLWLLVGGITAIGVIMTRWPAIKLLPPDQFYTILTAHGVDMLLLLDHLLRDGGSVLCLLDTAALPPGRAEVALGPVLADGRRRHRDQRRHLPGRSSVMFTSYVPMQAAPHFYLGLILFAVGALIGCFVFMGTLVVAKGQDLHRLDPAGHLRRPDGLHHRRVHDPDRCPASWSRPSCGPSA